MGIMSLKCENEKFFLIQKQNQIRKIIMLKILPENFYFSTMLPHNSVELKNMMSLNQPKPQLGLSGFKPPNSWQYLFSIMSYQNILNLQLLKNQSLIANYLTQRKEQENIKLQGSKSSSQTTDSGSSSRIAKFQNYSISDQKKNTLKKQKCSHSNQIENSNSSNQKKAKKSKRDESSSEYEPENSDSDNFKISKSSQSKNVPKNFSKAILLFINRKSYLVRKLAQQQGINYEDFMEMVANLKGKINTIAELRSLWLEEENKYGKIFRILSSLYLRKHSLQHIFNSRVQNYSRHLKYRQKLAQVIKNPQEFTKMKDY